MTNILIVDDEKSVCRQVKAMLSNFGYASGYIFNPDILFSRLENSTFDLILMDIHMPGTNGITLLQRLKAHPKHQTLSVIMLTGEVDDQMLTTCFEAGATDFIHKPIREWILKARVTTALAAKHARDELEKLLSIRTAELKRINLQLETTCSELANVNEALKLFVPKPFLDRIFSQQSIEPGQLEEEKFSILFSDIRGYTQLSEKMTPQENFEFLNTYIHLMEPLITRHQGFIDKFIDDGIMALFDQNQSADDAVQAAIDMHREIQYYNVFREKNKQPPIHFGVGINTGPVMVGTLGTPKRLDSTVIGDHVNSAAQVEQLTKKYNARILITGYTYLEIQPEAYLIREIDTLKLRGKETPMTVYEVFDCDPPGIIEQKQSTRDRLFQGIVFYKTQEFEEATHLFEQCLEHFPQDIVAREYLKRCSYYQKYPPQNPLWEGVVEDTDYMLDLHVRRQAPRFPFKKSTNLYSKHSDGHFAGHTLDISRGGLRIELGQLFQVGEIILVEVFFMEKTLDEPLKQTPLKILSQVAWQREQMIQDRPEWNVGVEFIMLTAEQESALQQSLMVLSEMEKYAG